MQRQVAWGADVLDINVDHPQIDEAAIMPKVAEAVLSVVDMPRCIDSNEPRILEAGLKVTPGKPLVNSVNGEEKHLATVLPLVKDRGAAAIGRTIGNEGIPVEDIIIDPLVMTVGHNRNARLVTLKSIELIKKEYAVNMSLGASNVSFGLPDRHSVNNAFLALAMQIGITTSITDPIKLGSSIRAIDLLLGKNANSMRYLKYFRMTEKLKAEEAAAKASVSV